MHNFAVGTSAEFLNFVETQRELKICVEISEPHIDLHLILSFLISFTTPQLCFFAILVLHRQTSRGFDGLLGFLWGHKALRR